MPFYSATSIILQASIPSSEIPLAVLFLLLAEELLSLLLPTGELLLLLLLPVGERLLLLLLLVEKF
jgi:hypothetical protein